MKKFIELVMVVRKMLLVSVGLKLKCFRVSGISMLVSVVNSRL